MAQGSRPPANAQAMHTRLQALGVVDRVRQILLAADTTKDVTELICWVERHQGDVLVKASYMNHKKDVVSGRPTGVHVDFARFRVAEGAPFGPLGSSSLPRETVVAVHALLQA